jgi:iron-sulfur cluster repair protein YtfE (RIC family)
MTQSPSHDTPAGKTLAEHRALHALLDQIQKASAPEEPNTADLVERLDTLRERLAAHFDGEERSGLFDQIQELAPEQAHECAKLCDEHLTLLQRVDHLRTADPEVRSTPEWREGLRTMLSELAHHESAENELLNRVLDGSMEAQD